MLKKNNNNNELFYTLFLFHTKSLKSSGHSSLTAWLIGTCGFCIRSVYAPSNIHRKSVV